MIRWFLPINNLLRDIERKAEDALDLYGEGGKDAAAVTNSYMRSDYERLLDLWRQKFPSETLGNLGRHIGFGMDCDYRDIINNDLPDLRRRAEAHLLDSANEERQGLLGFEELLHPKILEHSYQLFRSGHLREAVLNSVTALYDYIRSRTGSTEDGDHLIGQVLSLQNPKLVLSELDSESGKNDQKGFMQIFKGAYQGIRNPKAHSLAHDFTDLKAAQYLVFASLMIRRVEEAKVVR